MKLETNCDTRENYNDLVEYIRDYVTNNEKVVIVNIGTDRSTGDSLAPMVGTILKENKCSLAVYGTMDEPIHAKNLQLEMSKIKELHPNAKIIAIDACLGSECNIGNIYIKDEPISPGSGLGKDLMKVGDISIYGVVNISANLEFMILQNTRLHTVYKLASMISNIIMEGCCENNNELKLYNTNTYSEIAI